MSIVEDQQSREPSPSAPLCAAEKLLTQTQLPGNCGKVLYDLAWKANLHPQLYGYAKTLAVLQIILQAVSLEQWDLTGSKDSDGVLDFAINHVLGDLKPTIEGLASDSDHAKRVLRMVGTNPLYDHGSKHHGLNYILCDDLPEGAAEITQAKWLALKAHLLRAHMRITAHDSTPESWLMGDKSPATKFSQSLYDVCGRFARYFPGSQPQWLTALSLMPDFSPPQTTSPAFGSRVFSWRAEFQRMQVRRRAFSCRSKQIC